MTGKRILIIDHSKDRKKSPEFTATLEKEGYSLHYLHNSSSLSDSLFIRSFDFVIINLLKGENSNSFPKEKCKKIVLIGSSEKHLLSFAKNANAIVRKENLQELLTAIAIVNQDGFYVSEDFREQLLQRVDSNHYNAENSLSTLTQMELKVAEELARDKTNQQIADSLYLSKRTVEYHIAACMNKLNVNSRVGLAVKIVTSNLLTKDTFFNSLYPYQHYKEV